MGEKPTRDDVLRRMLKTPPTPHDEQPKVKKPPNQAERDKGPKDGAVGQKDRPKD